MKGARIFHRKGLGETEGGHAAGALDESEILQSLEGLERIGVKFAAIVNARQARTFEKIVGENFVPQIDDFFRLREETMPADVEQNPL